MKKNNSIILLTTVCLFFTSLIHAQTNDVKDDVMLQGYYWNSFLDPTIVGEGGTYAYLNNRATEYANAQFDLIWLPPPSDGYDNGYLPRQLFLFDSNHGTTAQLTSLVSNLKSKNIHSLADIVLNHRNGTNTTTGFTNPTWGCEAIVTNDDISPVGSAFPTPCGGLDEGEGFPGVQDISHRSVNVQNGYKEYLSRLKTVGFDSWRYDFAKGIPAKYVAEYNASSSPYVSIGEYWEGNLTLLTNWMNATKNTLSGATAMSSAFDFPLKYIMHRTIGSSNYSELDNGGKMPGLAGAYGFSDKAITFVENHDTAREHSTNDYFSGGNENRMRAYAYILTHPGIPMVFLPHYEANKTKITELISVRKRNGINAWSTILISNSSNFYSATIDNKVAVKIGGGSWAPTGTGWTLRTSGVDYAVWDKTVLPTLSITPVGNNFVTGTTVNVTLSSPSNTIYYTTNGSTPTISSTSAVGSVSLVISSNTTIKAFAKDILGNVTPIQTENYTFSTATAFTVYFKKPSNWNGAVKIYYWNPTGTAPSVSWPGVAMTKDCGDWYSYTFPNTVSASNLIFTDGTLKTGDLTSIAGIKYYDGSWLSSEPVNRCNVIQPGNTLTVYFKPPSAWNNTIPKVYYWSGLPSGTIANANWPGVAMTLAENGYYRYTLTGPTTVNVIFNNGSSGSANQTPNLIGKSNGFSYTWGDTSSKEGTVDELEIVKSNVISLYPNPFESVLYIESVSLATTYAVYSLDNRLVQSGKPNYNYIDLSILSSGVYVIRLNLENGKELTQRIVKN